MQIQLSRDQEEFIRQAIRSGRIDRAEDAVTEALLLWEERERLRSEFLASLDAATTSVANGEGTPITEASMQALANEVKRRSRECLAQRRTADGA
jgi:Arc/MetJ-type ribon-helix-helix transcriptional regulator